MEIDLILIIQHQQNQEISKIDFAESCKNSDQINQFSANYQYICFPVTNNPPVHNYLDKLEAELLIVDIDYSTTLKT